MIHLIYGAKGSGKTKRIIDKCNDDAMTSKGLVVFLSDTNRYMYDLKYQVRFANVKEFEIETVRGLLGFIRGMIAGNKDIKTIYIDGAHRMAETPIEEMQEFYDKLDKVAEKNEIQFYLTVSLNKEDFPEFLKKYLED